VHQIWNLFDIVINKSEALPGGSLTVLLLWVTLTRPKTIYLEIILSLFDVKMGPQYFYNTISCVYTKCLAFFYLKIGFSFKVKARLSAHFFSLKVILKQHSIIPQNHLVNGRFWFVLFEFQMRKWYYKTRNRHWLTIRLIQQPPYKRFYI
jgi:hypothetical protein